MARTLYEKIWDEHVVADLGGGAPGDEAALLNYDIQMSLNP